VEHLKQKTMSGLRWMTVTTVVQRVLGLGAIIILARLLEPADFGLYSLAFVVIDALTLFHNFGIDAALVQHKGDEQLAADTAFWISGISGSGKVMFPASANWCAVSVIFLQVLRMISSHFSSSYSGCLSAKSSM